MTGGLDEQQTDQHCEGCAGDRQAQLEPARAFRLGTGLGVLARSRLIEEFLLLGLESVRWWVCRSRAGALEAILCRPPQTPVGAPG